MIFWFGIGLSSSTTRSVGSRRVFYQVKYIDFSQSELCTKILKQYIMGSDPYDKHLSHCSQKAFSPIQLKDHFLFLEVLTLAIYHFGSSTCASRVHCANQLNSRSVLWLQDSEVHLLSYLQTQLTEFLILLCLDTS